MRARVRTKTRAHLLAGARRTKCTRLVWTAFWIPECLILNERARYRIVHSIASLYSLCSRWYHLLKHQSNMWPQLHIINAPTSELIHSCTFNTFSWSVWRVRWIYQFSFFQVKSNLLWDSLKIEFSVYLTVYSATVHHLIAAGELFNMEHF